MDEYLTIAEIASKLNIPESTVRYYRDRFPEFIPYIGEGRKRRYKAETVEIIQAIAEGLRNNQTAEYIAEQLRHKYSTFAEIDERNETIAVMKSMLAQLQEDKEKLQEEKRILEEKNERLFNEFMELNKKYIEISTQKGFLSRLFKKK